MKLRFCTCGMCRYQRKLRSSKKAITKLKRHNRRKSKQLIKQEEFDKVPEKTSIPYTI